MLILPIRREWYDKILRREKLEEYRSKNEYWWKRLNTACGGRLDEVVSKGETFTVCFRNGYGNDKPTIEAVVRLRIGRGKYEWGAVPDVDYFVLCLEDIKEVTGR